MPPRVGAGVEWMRGRNLGDCVGPLWPPVGDGRAHSPRGTTGSHKGPYPTPHRSCPYAMPLAMAKTYP